MRYLLLLIAICFSVTITAQTDTEKVKNTINKSTIEGHIYFLADDLLKGRETGTPENKIAAAYLANTLRSYGILPNPQTGDYYQPVELKKVSPPENASLSINNQSVSDMVALEATSVSYSDNAIYLGYGLDSDYEGKNVTNKLIIVQSGGPEAQDTRAAFRLRGQKKALAQKNGALGIIELLDADDNIWGFIDHNFNAPSLSYNEEDAEEATSDFAYIWVYDKEGAMNTSLSSKATVPVSLSLEANKEEIVTSQNVIGVVEGTDPELKKEYIIYSAHYDHVGIGTPDESGDTIYNGARDNAVGTTTVLSMAENLAKYPTKRSALFILFTGEEKGLLGSKYYVENPVLPLNQMVYCFNSDNAGYNDTSLATIIGLPRTTAASHIKKAAQTFGLTAVDDPAPEQGLFDRSDNVHFAAKGIPSPTFSLGFTAFNGDVTKYYHRPGDSAESLDYEYLFKFFSAYVLAGRSIANDPVTPVWTIGDKYEAAAKALYKN